MATLAAVFSFFTLHILVLMTDANGDPLMDVHPSEIRLGISSTLDINCSFSPIEHPEMADFASLIVSRANSSDQEFQDLAAVTQFSPGSVTVLTEENMSAIGVHSQTGESFIHLKWDYPTELQSGVYKCTAYGLDILGECLEVGTTSVVTVEEANLNDIFEKLKQMEIHGIAMENKISYMEKHIETLEYNNSLLSSYITDNDHVITSMEKKIQDLQKNSSQMSSYTTESFISLRIHHLIYLGTYQNHDYYISKEAYGEINHAMDVCKSYGGYLVELDNESEFNAIKSFLNHTSGFNHAMIAGTDEESDGTWLFQSNNKPLPFTSWKSTGASTGPSNDCLGLRRDHSWNMDDWPCNYGSPQSSYRFTCEIPRV